METQNFPLLLFLQNPNCILVNPVSLNLCIFNNGTALSPFSVPCASWFYLDEMSNSTNIKFSTLAYQWGKLDHGMRSYGWHSHSRRIHSFKRYANRFLNVMDTLRNTSLVRNGQVWFVMTWWFWSIPAINLLRSHFLTYVSVIVFNSSSIPRPRFEQ